MIRKLKVKAIKAIGYVGVGVLSAGSALAAYTPNYTPTDMPNIATDLIGSAGVETKTYMPLIVLGFVLVIGAGAIVKVRRAF